MVSNNNKRQEHEDICEPFLLAISGGSIDKSSTFRAPYSETSDYHMWISKKNTRPFIIKSSEYVRLRGIGWCPFCGAELT